jgi:hypothetical protein
LQEAGGSSTICDVDIRSKEAENEDYEKIGLMLEISLLIISGKNRIMDLPSNPCTFVQIMNAKVLLKAMIINIKDNRLEIQK